MAGKLRHLALSVPDRYAAADFYEKIFEMDRMAENETPDAKVIYLSDGVMSLALIEYQSGHRENYLMQIIAKGYSEEQLRIISKYYSLQGDDNE